MEKFITGPILDKVVAATNTYAEWKIGNKRRPEQRQHQASWTETHRLEISALFAIIVLMGIVVKPNLKSYFSKDKTTETPFFRTCFSRDRFLSLLEYLHFVNREDEDEEDRLRKLGPIIDEIVENCKKVFVPNRNVSLDESLFKFHGRLAFRVYNPMKRARFGIKVYKLCASDGRAAGYTYNFYVYTGQDKNDAVPASQRPVIKLTRPILNKGYNLYLDNYFNSPALFRRLHQQRLNVCGTLNLNRVGVPKFLQKLKLKKGEVVSRTDRNGLMILLWKDKKIVKMITTMHRNDVVDSGKRNRANEPIHKPRCVMDYNNGMGGVDRSDQLGSSHRSVRKFVKWYKKLFFYIMDLCLVNSFCVFKYLNRNRNWTFLDFKMKYIEDVLDEALPHLPSPQNRGADVPPLGRLTPNGHFPEVHPPTAKKQRPCKQCVVCSKNGRRTESLFRCDVCKVALCVEDCFKRYHTVVDY